MWKVKGCDGFEGFLYTIDEFHVTLRVIQLNFFFNLAWRYTVNIINLNSKSNIV